MQITSVESALVSELKVTLNYSLQKHLTFNTDYYYFKCIDDKMNDNNCSYYTSYISPKRFRQTLLE